MAIHSVEVENNNKVKFRNPASTRWWITLVYYIITIFQLRCAFIIRYDFRPHSAVRTELEPGVDRCRIQLDLVLDIIFQNRESADSTSVHCLPCSQGKSSNSPKHDGLAIMWRSRRWTSATPFTGILSLAWAYILSSRLIELQQQPGAEVLYTGSTASGLHHDLMNHKAEDVTAVEIDIGEVDESTARWWAAILAPRQGWKTSVLKKEDEVYLSPWSLSLDKGPEFTVVWQDVGSHAPASAISPPSSQTALRLLAQFCSLHGLGK